MAATQRMNLCRGIRPCVKKVKHSFFGRTPIVVDI